MSLFDDCKLPDDDRALEILQRISDLWEDNANIKPTKNGNSRTYHQKVSQELKENLIRISTYNPYALEEMLNQEISLHNILRFAAGEAVD